jgi:hypothetical protein
MKPWLSTVAGVVTGYIVLAFAVLWLRNMCLPVSAQEFKWQCAASSWIVAAAYFGCACIASFFAARGQLAVAISAFAVLFLGHAALPDLAIISFGKRWYLNAYTLLFAVIPATLGVAAALIARRQAWLRPSR